MNCAGPLWFYTGIPDSKVVTLPSIRNGDRQNKRVPESMREEALTGMKETLNADEVIGSVRPEHFSAVCSRRDK